MGRRRKGDEQGGHANKHSQQASAARSRPISAGSEAKQFHVQRFSVHKRAKLAVTLCCKQGFGASAGRYQAGKRVLALGVFGVKSVSGLAARNIVLALI